MSEDPFIELCVICLFYLYFGVGGFVLWLLDKALSRVPRYRDWRKENLLNDPDNYDD